VDQGGYFPPAIAGVFNVKDNILGNALIWPYNLITKRLRYFDRVDFSFGQETEQALKGRFKMYFKELSGSEKHVLVACTSLTHTKDSLRQGGLKYHG
jgi:hypothetical protein